MKILIVNLDNGGIMHYSIDLSNSLMKSGVEIEYLGYEEAKELLNENCEVNIIRKRDFKQFIKKINSLIKYKNIDIIHLTGYHIFYVLLILIFKLTNIKIPIIYTVHDAKRHLSYINGRKITLKFLKEKLIYNDIYQRYIINNITKVITLSKYVNNQVKCIYKVDSEMILLSQDSTRYKKNKNTIKSKSFKILFFGIIDKYKGIEDLINAAYLLKSNNVEFELIIAGRNKYKEFPIPDILNENIVFINRFIKEEEIYDLFNNSSIVVLPYKEVSQSGVLALALAFFKPVIVTDLGSFKEYVIDGYNGYIVETNNYNELYKKIKKLIENPYILKHMEENSKKFFEENLNWNSLSIKYISIYKKCLKDSVK